MGEAVEDSAPPAESTREVSNHHVQLLVIRGHIQGFRCSCCQNLHACVHRSYSKPRAAVSHQGSVNELCHVQTENGQACLMQADAVMTCVEINHEHPDAL